jgi:ACS family hexuronate transporter-like MFS transporter
VALALGEGGSFPTSIKSVALWFPQRERALATSLFNTGANVGALLAPAIVPFIAVRWGWQAAFVAAAIAGFVWLIFWVALYETPDRSSRVNKAELNLIRDGAASAGAERPAAKLSQLLRHRQAWSFVVAKGLTDPVWWFFLIWLPDYFKQTRHLDIKNSWPHLVTIYAIVTVLSIIGGWIPGRLVRAGISTNAARKLTMLVAASLALPILAVTQVGDWSAAILIGLAGAAHQAWAANLYSTVADMFPKSVVGAVVGFGSMAGSLGAMVFPIVTGKLLDHYIALGNVTHGYTILFCACACAYVVAFVLQHLLAPRFEPVTLAPQ